jgi:hypothetical protein
MQLRPDIQIQSMIKAMIDVVIPSVDAANELAIQQAQLVLGHLVLMAQRMPLQYRADRDELDRLVAYAADIQTRSGTHGLALPDLIAEGADVLERARAEPSEILSTSRKLTEAVDHVIRSIFISDDAALQQSVQTATLAMSKDQLLRNRAWLIMQGWEPDPASVPAIETLLPLVPTAG